MRSRRTARCTAPITGTSSNARRPASAKSSSLSTGPAIANLPQHRRRSSGAAEALVGRHRRAGAQARCHRDDAGDSAGVGALSHQGVRRRPYHGAGTRQGLLGQGPAGHSIGQNNFDQLRYEFFRDDTVGARGVQGGSVRLVCRAQRQAMVDGLRFSRRARKAGHQGKIPGSRASGRMQGFAFNLRRPLFADVRVRRAFNFAYDWETSDRLLSNGEYHRDGSYFDGIPELMHGPSGRPGTADSRNGARQGARRGLHDAIQESGRRQCGGRRATIFVKPRACSKRQGLKIATASWSIPPASRSASNS